VLQRRGGVGLQHCAVTDDGVRCALEYNCQLGRYPVAPQAGMGVYEPVRRPAGRGPPLRRHRSTRALTKHCGVIQRTDQWISGEERNIASW
jgi:hypothetical protein